MLPYHRRAYCTSTDMRGTISCCTLVVNSQLKERFPQPVIRSGSYVLVGVSDPKAGLSKARHSPFGAKLFRSQSGTKSRSVSAHGRPAVVDRLRIGFGASVTCAGPNPVVPSPSRYLFKVTFRAVFPLPNTS